MVMSLSNGALCRTAVQEISLRRCILPSHPSIHRSNRLYCSAKVSVEDDKEKHDSSHKGFSIRVPTIPKLVDIESARRMLELAFQSLSFDMPRIPIDSALQGLAFDIFKLPISKQGFVFDITGFVATKLRKPPKRSEDVAVSDETVYPRCAWPRITKKANSDSVLSAETLDVLKDQQTGVNLELEENKPADHHLHKMRSAKNAELNGKVVQSKGPCVPSSMIGMGSSECLVDPHCVWPRQTTQFVNADRAPSAQSISSNVLYPRSAWPRKSQSCNGVVLDSCRSTVEYNLGSVAKEEEVSPCVIEGGARCAWPRKILAANRSCHSDDTTKLLSEDLCADGSKRQTDAEDGKLTSAKFEGTAELPRRMLATSVGLSVMNQLTKGSFVTSLFDFCSLLPAGNLEFAEEEDASLDVGRRTLLVFVKHSSG